MEEKLSNNNIREQLKWDDSVDASHFSVEASNGNVFLQGDVKSYAEKIMAARDAFMVPGVKHENNLNVQFPTKGNQPGDKQITHNVMHALQAGSEIKSNDIAIV